MNIQLKKLNSATITPTKNDGDAGYDLYCLEKFSLLPMERNLFKTGIYLSIPYGYYGHICDRSGNAYKKGLHVLAGIIDSTYRGEVGVILVNLGDEQVEIKEGDRIAQIIFKKYEEVSFTEVDELDQTMRNTGGFGSTGR